MGVDGLLLEVKQAFVDELVILAEKERVEQEIKKAQDSLTESKDVVDSMPASQDAVTESKAIEGSMPVSEAAVAMDIDEVAPAGGSAPVSEDAASVAPVALESNRDLPSAAEPVARDSDEDEHTDAENMEALPEGNDLLDGAAAVAAAPVVSPEEAGESMEPSAKMSTVEELEK